MGDAVLSVTGFWPEFVHRPRDPRNQTDFKTTGTWAYHCASSCMGEYDDLFAKILTHVADNYTELSRVITDVRLLMDQMFLHAPSTKLPQRLVQSFVGRQHYLEQAIEKAKIEEEKMKGPN
ncbi:TPA: hypothetical protein HA265_05660 [Candidatus Woesearchaeota archaeon]|nr:hypothetical protein [Candidatus Woesearchaeota archaeon]